MSAPSFNINGAQFLAVVAILGAIGSIIGGVYFVQEKFVPREEHDRVVAEIKTALADAKAEFNTSIKQTYLELKIDSHTITLEYIERDGITDDEKREHEVLTHSMKSMMDKLMELNE